MPRGNDADAASRELASRYRTRGNAEDLIQANRLRRDTVLAKASLLSVDEDATSELSVADVQKQVDDDNVVAFAVRGDYLTYVSEDPDTGAIYKGATVRKGTAAEKRGEKPKSQLPEDEEALAKRKAAVETAAREGQEEVERKTQEAREKADEEASKKVTQAAEKADKQAEKDSKSAEKDK